MLPSARVELGREALGTGRGRGLVSGGRVGLVRAGTPDRRRRRGLGACLTGWGGREEGAEKDLEGAATGAMEGGVGLLPPGPGGGLPRRPARAGLWTERRRASEAAVVPRRWATARVRVGGGGEIGGLAAKRLEGIEGRLGSMSGGVNGSDRRSAEGRFLSSHLGA